MVESPFMHGWLSQALMDMNWTMKGPNLVWIWVRISGLFFIQGSNVNRGSFYNYTAHPPSEFSEKILEFYGLGPYVEDAWTFNNSRRDARNVVSSQLHRQAGIKLPHSAEFTHFLGFSEFSGCDEQFSSSIAQMNAIWICLTIFH